jgi:hypothetical protein
MAPPVDERCLAGIQYTIGLEGGMQWRGSLPRPLPAFLKRRDCGIRQKDPSRDVDEKSLQYSSRPPMNSNLALPLMFALAVLSAAAAAQPLQPSQPPQPGFFAGLDVSGGMAQGSSSTRDGGAPFAGGGIVRNLKFDNTVGIGGHAGYRFSALSVFLSYAHIRGDVSWDAVFPGIGAASGFAGAAASDVILANVAYEFPLSDAVALSTSGGVGVAFNALSGLEETDRGTGLFLSDVAGHTQASPAARLGVGLRYRMDPNLEWGLDASVLYTGGFRTGDTRRGNLGVTGIVPYEIDDVWRADLGVSFRYRF